MRALYLASVWMHILAAMTWIGGMIVVVTTVMPEIRRIAEPHRSAFRWHFIGRLRVVMWTALVLAGATGVLNLGLRGVRAEHFLDASWRASAFGHAATMKIALFVAGAGLTALHERLNSIAAARWLGRLVLGLGLVVVWLAVTLVRGT